MPKNAQTSAQLHTSHMLVNNAQNFPSQASAIREPELPDDQAGKEYIEAVYCHPAFLTYRQNTS